MAFNFNFKYLSASRYKILRIKYLFASQYKGSIDFTQILFIFPFYFLSLQSYLKFFKYSSSHVLSLQFIYSNFIGEMNKELEINVDEVIKTLLDVRTAKPGKMVKLTEQ